MTIDNHHEWYIVILIDPKSIKDISSLPPPPQSGDFNLFLLQWSWGTGTSAFPEYCLWEETVWHQTTGLTVPGDLHTVSEKHWLLGSVTFSKHLRSHGHTIWQLFIRLLSSPGITLGCSQSFQVKITITCKLPEMPIPSSTHCLLNRTLLGVGGVVGGVQWDPTIYLLNLDTPWLIGISRPWRGSEGTDS